MQEGRESLEAVRASAWGPDAKETAGVRPTAERFGAAWLVNQIERERAQWFLWAPVCFAIGALIYFSLMREPSWPEVAAVVVFGLFAFLVNLFPLWRSTFVIVLASFGAVLASGFTAAKIQTEIARAPVISPWLGVREITGDVQDAGMRPDGAQRIIVQVVHIEGLVSDKTPARIRVLVRKGQNPISVGQRLRFRARLSPPPGPVVPGGYDFARWAYFQGIGGVGFVTSKIELLPDEAGDINVSETLGQLRQAISQRIQSALPGQAGAIATALTTGERTGLSEETNDAFRNSGLFHILSISGLHMAIMGGSIFFLVRFLLALFPHFALQFPIKKWAAATAIVGALCYLLISGGSFATVRSFIMIAVMFLAILLDRPALALRNVAVAALVILILFPASVFDPGFQMSFAAVLSLIAGYEAFSTWWYRRYGNRETNPGLRAKIAAFLFGIVMSTVLASTAVAPIAAYHFHTGQQLAVLANLLAVPITNFVVMPALLASLIAMPFGLEVWPLAVMGFGLEGMMWVAEWVSSLPMAVLHIPAFSSFAFALFVFGGLWLALMQSSWRVLGLVPIAAGLLLAPMMPRGDVFINRDGRVVAVRTLAGELVALNATRSTFAIENWLARDGDSRSAKVASVSPDQARRRPFRCDSQGCLATVKDWRIAIVRRLSALREDCASASIIIAPMRIPPGLQKRCHMWAQHSKGDDMKASLPLVIDRTVLSRMGAHAIYLQDNTFPRIETVADVHGTRLWSAVLQRPQRFKRKHTTGRTRDKAKPNS